MTKIEIELWLKDNVSPEVLSTATNLLNVTLAQSVDEIGRWIFLLATPGRTMEAYALAYSWLSNDEFLAAGEAITADMDMDNAANAERMAAFGAAVRGVLLALVTFGVKVLLAAAPFALAL